MRSQVVDETAKETKGADAFDLSQACTVRSDSFGVDVEKAKFEVPLLVQPDGHAGSDLKAHEDSGLRD